MRPVTLPGLSEMSASIPVEIDLQPSGSGSLTRNGEEVHQDLIRATTDMLVLGATLYHTMDHNLYEIAAIQDNEPRFIIRRVNDMSDHAATLRQLKLCCYVVHQRLNGR